MVYTAWIPTIPTLYTFPHSEHLIRVDHPSLWLLPSGWERIVLTLGASSPHAGSELSLPGVRVVLREEGANRQGSESSGTPYM